MNTSEEKPARTHSTPFIPGWIFDFDLKPIPLAVLVYLWRCRNSKTGLCFPSVATIAETIKADRKTVHRALNELQRKGLLKRVPGRTGRSNSYALIEQPIPFLEQVSRQQDRQIIASPIPFLEQVVHQERETPIPLSPHTYTESATPPMPFLAHQVSEDKLPKEVSEKPASKASSPWPPIAVQFRNREIAFIRQHAPSLDPQLYRVNFDIPFGDPVITEISTGHVVKYQMTA